MSKIKVSLTSPKSGKTLIESKKVSLGSGECVFPFIYNEKEYTKCYMAKNGDWCATSLKPGTNKIKTYAYCVKEKLSKKKKVTFKNTKPESKKKKD